MTPPPSRSHPVSLFFSSRHWRFLNFDCDTVVFLGLDSIPFPQNSLSRPPLAVPPHWHSRILTALPGCSLIGLLDFLFSWQYWLIFKNIFFYFVCDKPPKRNVNRRVKYLLKQEESLTYKLNVQPSTLLFPRQQKGLASVYILEAVIPTACVTHVDGSPVDTIRAAPPSSSSTASFSQPAATPLNSKPVNPLPVCPLAAPPPPPSTPHSRTPGCQG